MKMNRLWGMRAYLIGPIDRVADCGVGWRKELTPWLENLGIVVLDPTDKPIDIGFEDIKERSQRTEFKENGEFDKLAEQVRLLRIVDLRMVDLSDFLIAYIDPSIHMCGSYEEIAWANRLKRPILCVVDGGKMAMPDWLFGMIPHAHIFDNWEQLKEYLNNVNDGSDSRHFKRWMFFNYNKMLPKVAYDGV